MSSDILFVGWIPGKPKDRKTLIRLGVKGKMIYDPGKTYYGTGCFSHCEATEEVMERLICEFHLPNPGSFTAMDEHGNQLRWKAINPNEQIYWSLRWYHLQVEALRDRLAEMEDSK